MNAEPRPSLEELRRAFQEGSVDRSGRSGRSGQSDQPEGGCPAAATIWEAVHGELPPDRLREVVEHTARCAACALEWRLARELSPERQANDNIPPAALPRRRVATWPRVAALAAGLLLAVSLPLLWKDADEPAVRGVAGSAVSFELLTPTLARENPELRWGPPLPPGATYDLTVTAGDTQLVYEEGLHEAIYLLPAEKLAGLPPGTRLSCRVKITLSDGQSEWTSCDFDLK